jgi:hypothetical protein
VTYKIRSAGGPLINGTVRLGKFEAKWPGLDWVFVIWVFGPSSEKGNTRKDTGNWVASWRKMFWRNLWDLRCFAKRI